MKLAMMYAYLKQDLDKIETEINQTIHARHPVLRDASLQLLQAGGKRLRPVFVLLAGKFGDYDFERIKTVAVSLELIHMASLVHDDVIDEAELRRGEPTVKSRWDNRIAMYTGDYIFARSLEYMSALESPRAHQVLSTTMVELVIGEVEQIKDKYRWNQSIRDYLRRIKRKTALLIASSCQLGAIASKLDDRQEKALMKYGYYIGMSYQIIDDILDFTSTEDKLGKPAGSDLKQGNVTLPVLYAMKNKEFSDLIKNTFHEGANLEELDMEPLIEYVKRSGAIEKSFRMSEMYLQKANQSLNVLPDIKAKNTLLQIAKYIGRRTF